MAWSTEQPPHSTPRGRTAWFGLWLLLCGMVPFLTHAGQEAPVILCLGDSLTAGYGLGRHESYPALLQERLRQRGHPHRVINAGVSGDTTAGALARLTWVLRTPPAIAIVVLGANDGLRGLSLTAMAQNLDGITTTLQRAGARVVLAGMRLPPNLGVAHTDAFAAVFPEVARRHQTAYIPFFLAEVAGRTELNQADGIHPNAAGYRRILDNVWPVLEPLL